MVVSQEVLDLAFSITYDVEEYSLNFIASSRTDVSLIYFSTPELLGAFCYCSVNSVQAVLIELTGGIKTSIVILKSLFQ